VTAIDSARAIIEAALSEFGGSLAVLTSFQREGIVVADLALQADPGIPVMTIDTGRLPESTLKIISSFEDRYGVAVERILPDPFEVNAMIEAHGRDLFYDDVALRRLCCNVRKVRPLARRMAGVEAYLTGIRRGQSDSRANVEFFDRAGSPVKISPLADWLPADVASYTRERGLPEHPLYAAGYTSIGCDPCTRAGVAGEDERAGRWWWENDAAKECGLHFTADGKTERTVDVLLRDILTKAHV
jgi:phosphoadenylyl-sulfate reductase (thioredoxin)